MPTGLAAMEPLAAQVRPMESVPDSVPMIVAVLPDHLPHFQLGLEWIAALFRLGSCLPCIEGTA